MALMLCDSEYIDTVTGQCQKWVEYVPLVPDLTNEVIATIWGCFLIGMLLAWCGKKLIRLFGV